MRTEGKPSGICAEGSHGIAAHACAHAVTRSDTQSIPALDHGIAAYTCVSATHSCSGSSLALTCTLLGISLGIGSLSGHELNPTTIPQVIKGLTEHFAMAFMTTVIGLPVSAALRSALLVSYSHAEERANPQFQKGE